MSASVVCFDDDPDMLTLLERTAAREGDFEVVGAAVSTDNLRELLEHRRPRVVVLDHEMIGSDWGLDTVELVRWVAPDALIAMFTGFPGLATASRNAGCHVHVEKPDFDALWAAIRDRLQDQPHVLDLRQRWRRPLLRRD